jgi:pyruvate dehydrogenase E2 component (dihydrolipoyllysine-residue acetyltransferase)
MIFEFKLPDLGEGITEGEVVKWRVKANDLIEEHQIVMEVETDKAIVEVPSPRKGKIVEISKPEGSTVKVGETLLKIDTEPGAKAEEKAPEKAAPAAEKSEEKAAVKKPAEEKSAPEKPAEERRPSLSVVGTLPESEEVMASPKARALAKSLGVDLAGVTGTGPGGMITEKDVTAAKGASKEAAPAAAPAEARPAPAAAKLGPVERVPIKGVRKAIVKNLLASQSNAAFVTGMDDADVTDLWDLREREGRVAKERKIHLTFMPFFMKAVQHALVEHPFLNASVDEKGEEIIVKKYYNIGVAVQTPDGLMVAVVKDVDKKTILELASELQELSKKARDRKITLEELKGSTFTITNYGGYGGTYATPIINYPDVAILGTGKISERPWVKDGKVVPRKILPLSLTFDHRVIDGAEAAIFLTKIVKYLEDPARIFIESA